MKKIVSLSVGVLFAGVAFVGSASAATVVDFGVPYDVSINTGPSNPSKEFRFETAAGVEKVSIASLATSAEATFQLFAGPDSFEIFNLNPDEFVVVDVAPDKLYKVSVTGLSGFTSGNIDFRVTAVPIPAAAWLFGTALLGASVVARRRDKRSDGSSGQAAIAA